MCMHAHALPIFNTAISNPNQTSGSATAAVVLLPMAIIVTIIIKFV